MHHFSCECIHCFAMRLGWMREAGEASLIILVQPKTYEEYMADKMDQWWIDTATEADVLNSDLIHPNKARRKRAEELKSK